MRSGFDDYKLVYGHIWKTYGASWLVRLSFALQIVGRICKLIALPIILSLIITRLSERNYSGAQHAVLLYICFSSVLGALTPLIRYIGTLGDNKVYAQLTAVYFAKLVSADLDYFNSNLSGYLTTATRHYVDNSVQLMRAVRDRYSTTILSIVFPIGVILWLDWQLGVVALALSIISAAYMIWASHAIAEYRSHSRELYKGNSGRMADIISNILAVKSTAQEARYVDRVRRGAHLEAAAFTLRYKVQARLIAVREALTVVVFGILFSLTVHRMSSGAISLTTAVLVITYATTILNGIYALSDDLDQHDDFIDTIIPAFEILNRRNTVEDSAQPVAMTEGRGAITFNHVSFSYDSGTRHRPVLKDFSLTIPDGQKIGIVGMSGAGKSTLTKLLLRFNDVDSCDVLIDGVNIRHALQTDVRQHIAYVPQEPLLFHASIRDNVLLSQPDATDAQVERALNAAHAGDFVHQLPDRLDSIVGERGVKLSGGQKQRIAIARAVLQNAPIFVLDEATSALDSESEQIIKDSFAEIFKGKTAIVVAHRLSTLSEMDRIIVIDKGQLVEDGTHDELILIDRKYAALWKRQST